MHEFTFKNNELYCEGIKVSDVAKKVSTPFYLYSYKTLMDHYRKVGNMEFPHQLTVDRPLYGCRVTLKLSSPKFNNPKVDNRKIFEPRKPPPGWDVIDLDYEPLSNVKTFSGEQ